MDKSELLKKIEILSNEIAYNYWKYYNNFVLSDLYNKDIYNNIIDFYWNCKLNIKQLKKYYIKNKLELENAIINNQNIINFSKSFWNYINNNLF